MKLYELTINENGVRFRRANPDRLTKGQKYNIIVSLIVAATVLGIFLGMLTILS